MYKFTYKNKNNGVIVYSNKKLDLPYLVLVNEIKDTQILIDDTKMQVIIK